ncbi:MAG: GHKL domain-containing protein [Clostridia bacterium]|nr:GHKL domain-containing protein [Clostridia bacterium]
MRWLFLAIIAYGALSIACSFFVNNIVLLVLKTSFLFLASLAYGFLICRSKNAWVMLSCFVYKCVSLSVGLLSLAFFSTFTDFEAVLPNSNDSIRVLFLLTKNALLIISLWLIIVFVNRTDPEVRNHDDEKSTIVLSIVLVVLRTISCVSLLSFLSADPKKNGVPCFFMNLLIGAIFIVICWLIYRVLVLSRKAIRKNELESRIAWQREQNEKAVAAWDKARRIRHDTNQHLQMIRGFLLDGSNEKCLQYIDSLLPVEPSDQNFVHLDNEILDFLINSKIGVLQGTEVVVSGKMDCLAGIRDTDLVALFGNLIDNAVEAVADQKNGRIELVFSQHGSNRIIFCKNTIEKSVLQNNGSFQSTKSNPEFHGLGHKIVEETVARLGGIVDYSEENNMFVVTVVIPA